VTRDERQKLNTLKRRVTYLEERVAKWNKGWPPAVRDARELSALKWAVGVLEGQIPSPSINEDLKKREVVR
jgi:hypothetical protein